MPNYDLINYEKRRATKEVLDEFTKLLFPKKATPNLDENIKDMIKRNLLSEEFYHFLYIKMNLAEICFNLENVINKNCRVGIAYFTTDKDGAIEWQYLSGPNLHQEVRDKLHGKFSYNFDLINGMPDYASTINLSQNTLDSEWYKQYDNLLKYWRSIWSIPILTDDKSYGTLFCYYPKPYQIEFKDILEGQKVIEDVVRETKEYEVLLRDVRKKLKEYTNLLQE